MPTYAVRTKRDTAANLVAANRVYGDGTIVVERGADGVSRLKCGNGTTSYNSLPYIADQSAIGPGVSVRKFGAVGNGIADDAVAIQNTINFAQATGDAVFFPAGEWRTTQTLNITERVTLYGVGASPYSGDAHGARGKGSWLFFDHSGVGIFIANQPNSIIGGVFIRDIGTRRNQPDPAPGWQPIDHDYEISQWNTDLYIHNVLFWNATRGVRVQQGNYGRLTIDNLRAHVFKVGILIEESYDLPRISNVHFWPFWWDDYQYVHAYTLQNLYGVLLYRCDGLQLHNYFIIKAFAGLVFGQNSFGAHLRGQYSNIYIDLSTVGILVDTAVQSMSFQASNVVCASSWPDPGIGMRVRGNNCRIDISNMEVCFCNGRAIGIEGTGNRVLINGLRVTGWNWSNIGAAAIHCDSGNTVVLGSDPALEDGRGGPLRTGAGTITKPVTAAL